MIDMNDIYERYSGAGAGPGRDIGQAVRRPKQNLYDTDMPTTDPNFQPWEYNVGQGGAYDPYGVYGASAYDPNQFQFNYPSQWGEAEAYYQKLLGGDIPEAWQTGQGVLTRMARGGAPVDVSGLYGAQEAVGLRGLERYAKEQAERMGIGGKRWSSPLQARITEYSGQLAENLAAQQAQAQIAAEEAARQRQLAATGQLYQYGTGVGGLGMQAAQGLTGLGQMYAQLPMDVASQMFQMGGGMQQMQQQEIDPVLQQFLRTAPENDPWLQYAMQYLGQQPSGIPETYQPSFLTQMLGTSGGLLANPQIQQALMGLFNKGGGAGPINYAAGSIPGAMYW